MNAYDFDKTIYAGDSSVDFYMYCLLRHPVLYFYILKQAKGFLLYITGKIDSTHFKEHFFSFLERIPDIKAETEAFWDLKQKKIRDWYLKQQQKDDIVISASPAFLLKPICQRLGIMPPIATEVDPSTGKINGRNCKGEEKIQRFLERYPNEDIEKFYSDSRSDTPLAHRAKEAFLVRGNKLLPWS